MVSMMFELGGDYEKFEQDLEDSIKGGIHNTQVCAEVWGGLTNIIWVHKDYGAVAYTFRSAGDLLADLRGKGSYMDWYCSGPSGVVPRYMSDGMGRLGWFTEHYTE